MIKDFKIQKDQLTQEILKEYFHYCPLSGVWTQIKKTHAWDNTRRLHAPLGYVDGRGHVHFSVFGFKYKAHRLAWFYMTGKWPKDQIDHIDGNKTNNIFSNLREATNAENQLNRRKIKAISGYKGVYPYKRKDGKIIKWAAQYNKKHLGVFLKPEDAAKVYDEYIVSINPEFAATNKDISNV